MANPFIYKPTDVGQNIGDIARAFYTRGKPITDAAKTFSEGLTGFQERRGKGKAADLLLNSESPEAGMRAAIEAGVGDQYFDLSSRMSEAEYDKLEEARKQRKAQLGEEKHQLAMTTGYGGEARAQAGEAREAGMYGLNVQDKALDVETARQNLIQNGAKFENEQQANQTAAQSMKLESLLQQIETPEEREAALAQLRSGPGWNESIYQGTSYFDSEMKRREAAAKEGGKNQSKTDAIKGLMGPNATEGDFQAAYERVYGPTVMTPSGEYVPASDFKGMPKKPEGIMPILASNQQVMSKLGMNPRDPKWYNMFTDPDTGALGKGFDELSEPQQKIITAVHRSAKNHLDPKMPLVILDRLFQNMEGMNPLEHVADVERALAAGDADYFRNKYGAR